MADTKAGDSDDTSRPLALLDTRLAGVTPIRTFSTGKAPHKAQLTIATGFFFLHDNCRYLITCGHVFYDKDTHVYPDSISFTVHCGRTADVTRAIDLPLYDGSRRLWLECDNQECDVAAIRVDEWLKLGDVIHYWTVDHFLPASQERTLPVGSSLVVLGYPGGLYDVSNCLPLAKTASLGSAYGLGYGGKPYFLIDGRLHPGSSGSPVITSIPTIFLDDQGSFVLEARAGYLLGVNAGPEDSQGIDADMHRVFHANIIRATVEKDPSRSKSDLKE